LQKRGYRQEVTGLIVNDRVNVKQDYIKDLRKWLYYGEVYGRDRANTLYFQDRSKEAVDTQQIKELGKVLSGKLSHLRMVVGAKNKAYLKLKERLQGLISPPKTITQEAIKTVAAVEQSSSLNTLLVAETQEVYLSRPTSKGPVTSPRRPLPHNPFYTAKFLNQFAVADRSGFKELVHDIELNDQIIEEILEKVKSHPNFRYHYKNQRVAIKFVNKAIQREIIKVIDLFESTGVPYFKKTGKHPFNHEPQYTELAKKLKAMYRFGTGGEATSLQRDILETAAACKVSKEFISFLPDARAFNIRTGAIYTWAPAIAKGLKYIFQGIADHSNVEGNKSRETTIVITAEHFPDDDKYRRNVQLTILNKYSQPTVNSSDLLSKLRGSEPFQNYFRSLCDWIVESDFYEESSKRLNVLVPDKLPDKQKYKDVEGLDTKAGGFKHKLIFYRGR